MTLDEYILQLKQNIEEFKKTWEAGFSENPDNFPMNMESSEWDYQYIFFMEWEYGAN